MKIEYTTTRIGNLKVQTDAVNGKNKVSGIEYKGEILKPTTRFGQAYALNLDSMERSSDTLIMQRSLRESLKKIVGAKSVSLLKKMQRKQTFLGSVIP